MDENLKEYLRKEFYKCNHNKYLHYFELWVSNLTKAQIAWYKNYYGEK